MARPSARERLLDCAELLFAERGLRGASLRAINAEAGLSPAALHYHFGTQQALVEALLERRMPALMARRAELLDALDAAAAKGEPPTARAVLATLVRPMAELLRDHGEAGLRYLRLVSRLHAEGDLDHAWVIGRHPGGVERLGPLMRAALPELPEPLLMLRAKWAIDVLLFSLAQGPAAFGEGLDQYVSALLDFVTGAMAAPITGGSV
ncbi:MAG: TetR family transcriptional regulator [Actinomycetota bacterium]|nr:TetR family transcriptional regulator [Actinomycetota bacterium]